MPQKGVVTHMIPYHQMTLADVFTETQEPGILQVHLSDYCFFEADELFFSDSSEMR